MALLKQKRTVQVIILLFILLLAAVLRLWRLDTLPPGLYHDEAYNGLDALSLLQGKQFPQFYEGWELYAQNAHADNPANETRWPLFFEGNYGREPLHIYLMALSIRLFGSTPLAIRLVPALAGIVAVWTTYLAAGALLKKEEPAIKEGSRLTFLALDPALIAALMLAILFPAILFSRFGVRAMLFVPIETLTVYFFWSGINRSKVQDRNRIPVWFYFLVAGFFLGLGLYSYAAARLFPLLFVLFVPYWFWRDRAALRQQWSHVLAMAGIALITALPILFFFARYPYFFLFRIGYVANKGKGVIEGKPWLTWLLNVGRVFRGFIWQGETHLRHNLPGRPYLDPIQVLFLLLGFFDTFRQRLQLRQVFLWIWLLVMLLPSILSGDAPHSGRLIGAAPVVAIFIALGIVWLSQTAIARLNERYARFVAPVIGLLLLLSALLSVGDYFCRYARQPQLSQDFYQADWQLGRLGAAQGPETTLYLVPNQEEMATIYFALGDPERLQSFAGLPGLIPAGISGQPALYLIRPDEAGLAVDLLAVLSAYFPDGQVGQEADGLITFRVPAGAERLQPPPDATLSSAEDVSITFADELLLRGYSMKQDNDQLAVSLIWQANRDMDLEYTAYVHVLDSNGQLVAQHDRPPAGYPTSDWLAGEFVVDRYLVSLPPDLAPGSYTLQTGFYYLPTQERVGEPAVLTEFIFP